MLNMADDNLRGFELKYKLLREEVDDLEHKKAKLQKDIANQRRKSAL